MFHCPNVNGFFSQLINDLQGILYGTNEEDFHGANIISLVDKSKHSFYQALYDDCASRSDG